jgi:hypothetical protein
MTIPKTPWDRLYADVKVSLPGVTDAVYAQELFRCAKDFFDQTNIWQEIVPITGLPNTITYPFTVAGKGTPNRLLIIYDPALSANPNDRRWIQNSVSMQAPGEIVVGYAPSAQVQWEAVIAKNIVDPTTADHQPEIDDGTGAMPDATWIVDKYRDAFYYGTLARLQRQPTKPYSNPALARDNMQQYITQRGKARTDTLKKNSFGAQAWIFPQNYATVARKGWV